MSSVAQNTYNADVRLHTIKGYASNQLECVPVRRSRAQEQGWGMRHGDKNAHTLALTRARAHDFAQADKNGVQ